MKEDTEEVSVSLRIPAPDPELFRHKATDDVLLFLSRHRFDEFSISEIARHTGHTEPAVKRSVDVLAGNGLVVDEPEGNRRLVRIERERLSVPDDPYLRIPQKEFRDPVKTAIEELKNRLEDLRAVVLYGSVARGDADRRSDIDLWVLVGGDRAESQREANRVKKDLEDMRFDGDRYAYDIDVESVSSLLRYTDDVREIVASGIPLHETESYETVERLLVDEMEEVSEDG